LDVSAFLADSGGAQEFGTEFLGFLLVNRACQQATEGSDEAEGQSQSFHIECFLLLFLKLQR
jgi:hypothetical protein